MKLPFLITSLTASLLFLSLTNCGRPPQSLQNGNMSMIQSAHKRSTSVHSFAPVIQGIKKALKNHPRITDSRAQLTGAREKPVQARSAMLPQVGLRVQQGFSRIGLKDPFGNRINLSSSPGSATLELRQSIFNQQNSLAHKKTGPYVESFVHNLEMAKQTLILDVIDAAISLLQAQELARLARKNLKRVQTHLESLKDKLEAGLTTPTGIHQSKARVASYQASLAVANNNVTNAQVTLRLLIGYPIETAFTVPPIAEMDSLRINNIIALINKRPDVKAAKKGLRAAEINVSQMRAGHYPTFDLVASTSRNWGTEMMGGIEQNQEHYAGAVFNLSLYNGGATSSKVREAIANREAILAQLDDALRMIKREIEFAHNNLHSAIAQNKALNSSIKSAKTTLNSVQTEFDNGISTALNVLDAQHELFGLQSDRVISTYNVVRARYNLRKATGGLTPQWIESL